MFGTASPAPSIPRMWLTPRDFMVIGTSVILPDLVSARLEAEEGMERKDEQANGTIRSTHWRQLHYLGLDLYNRNVSHLTSRRHSVLDRSYSLIKAFGLVVTARIARIVPGYSIGGVWNTYCRDSWKSILIQREVSHTMMTTTRNSSSSFSSQLQTNNLPLVTLLRGGTKGGDLRE